MSITETTRPTTQHSAPIDVASAGPGSLSGHVVRDTHFIPVAEGTSSPQVTVEATSKLDSPAGSKTSRSQRSIDAHDSSAAADDFPGGQSRPDAQAFFATGDQVPPAVTSLATPNRPPLLADPILALAADVLGDLEKVRIANENRFRQLTRCTEDSDGEMRGFGLDEAHPDVARLSALVGMLAEAEHKATLNLQRIMRKHLLGPWVAAQKGVGDKQAARLLATIGDPYIRPEITREDGTVEPARPRIVSELWAYCGYHVVAGVAPKHQRGQQANWSADAKMRAFLVAESCMKQSGTRYRAVYDTTKAKYADAIHAAECSRCGPKGCAALAGSPLSDGHKHARALRAVAKEVLRDLWREAKRIHEEASAGSHLGGDTQRPPAASGSDHPVVQHFPDAHNRSDGGGLLPA